MSRQSRRARQKRARQVEVEAPYWLPDGDGNLVGTSVSTVTVQDIADSIGMPVEEAQAAIDSLIEGHWILPVGPDSYRFMIPAERV